MCFPGWWLPFISKTAETDIFSKKAKYKGHIFLIDQIWRNFSPKCNFSYVYRHVDMQFTIEVHMLFARNALQEYECPLLINSPRAPLHVTRATLSSSLRIEFSISLPFSLSLCYKMAYILGFGDGILISFGIILGALLLCVVNGRSKGLWV